MPLSKKSNYLGQTELIEFIAVKNGLSRSMSKRVAQDICDFIVIGLVHPPHRVYLPRLGLFELDPSSLKDAKGLTDCPITFEVSSSTSRLFDPTLVSTETDDGLMEEAV